MRTSLESVTRLRCNQFLLLLRVTVNHLTFIDHPTNVIILPSSTSSYLEYRFSFLP